MYYIIDLTTVPQTILPNLEFNTEKEAIDWIGKNGDATIYSISKPS